jgi:AraC-like DNA-binding protein
MNIAASHLLHLIEYAEQRGIAREDLFDIVPYSSDHFRDDTATVAPESFYDVLGEIDDQLQDELFGIRAGRYLNMKALGLIYRISLEATNIEEAFFYLKDYLQETFPIITINTDVKESVVSVRLYIDNNREDLNRIIIENVLTVVAREIKLMAGESTSITVFSPFFTPDYPDSWSQDAYFGLQFPPVILQAALKDQSRLHLDILIPEYLKMIESLKTDGSFVSKVKIASLNLAKPELPALKMVADSFNITPRTLQRRLREEGATFREIINDLKRTISDMLLRHKRFSVADISFVLGYSEPAAYIHSFKKWHGRSPEKVRDELLQ